MLKRKSCSKWNVRMLCFYLDDKMIIYLCLGSFCKESIGDCVFYGLVQEWMVDVLLCKKELLRYCDSYVVVFGGVVFLNGCDMCSFWRFLSGCIISYSGMSNMPDNMFLFWYRSLSGWFINKNSPEEKPHFVLNKMSVRFKRIFNPFKTRWGRWFSIPWC